MSSERRRFIQHLSWASSWVLPFLFMAVALLLGPLVRWVDDRTRWTLLNFGAEGERGSRPFVGSRPPLALRPDLQGLGSLQDEAPTLRG